MTKCKFKARVLRTAVVAILLAIISSCGSGGGSSTSTANSNLMPSEDANQQGDTNLPAGVQNGQFGDGSWMLDDIVFTVFFSGAETVGRDERVHINMLVGDNLFEPSNGAYHGALLNINFSANGSGNYVVTDSSSANLAFAGTENVASLDVSAGVAMGNTVRWDSTVTSGSLTVTLNEEGRYFVSTIEPIVVTKTFESGNGIEGAPDQMSLEIRNINAIPDQFQ